jgi:hypothetical protein
MPVKFFGCVIYNERIINELRLLHRINVFGALDLNI